jgi:hypothetical protein
VDSLRTPAAARTAAQVATVVFAMVVLLQLMIALGILPVTLAWGGSQPALTTSLRFAGFAAVVVLSLSAYIIRRRAGLAGSGKPGRLVTVLTWVITAHLFLNTLANFASTSMGERLLFAPLTLVLAISCLVVSMSKTEG